MPGCHQSHRQRQRPLLQTGIVSGVSATGYPRARPTGNQSEAISMVGVSSRDIFGLKIIPEGKGISVS